VALDLSFFVNFEGLQKVQNKGKKQYQLGMNIEPFLYALMSIEPWIPHSSPIGWND
jgi:hypothetical protein